MTERSKELVLKSIKAYSETTVQKRIEMYNHIKNMVDKCTYYSTWESNYLTAGRVFLRIYKSKKHT